MVDVRVQLVSRSVRGRFDLLALSVGLSFPCSRFFTGACQEKKHKRMDSRQSDTDGNVELPSFPIADVDIGVKCFSSL